MLEEWREVTLDNCEGYFVSNLGRVKGPQGILKGQLDSSGYKQIDLRCRGHKHQFLHKLVALTFCSNPEKHREINHKDGNKLNNAASNLSWCSRKENMEHAARTGLTSKGSHRHNAKLTEEDVIHIRKLLEAHDTTQAAIAKLYLVDQKQISRIKHRQTWSHV